MGWFFKSREEKALIQAKMDKDNKAIKYWEGVIKQQKEEEIDRTKAQKARDERAKRILQEQAEARAAEMERIRNELNKRGNRKWWQ